MHRRACWDTSPCALLRILLFVDLAPVADPLVYRPLRRLDSVYLAGIHVDQPRLASMIAASTSRPSRLGHPGRGQDALIVGRHDLRELRAAPWPVGQHRRGYRAPGEPGMPGHHIVQPGEVLGVGTLQLDHLGVDHRRVEAEHESDAARHARGHVPTGFTEHHDTSAGHVLAGVVPHAFGHRERTGVAGTEAFADPAAEKDLAGRGAVQQRVARDHVVLGEEQHVVGRLDDDASTRKPLADIVVGVTDQLEGDARRQEGTDRLAGGAVSSMWMVSSGSPCAPYRRVTSAPSMVPTVRLTFRTGSSSRTG